MSMPNLNLLTLSLKIFIITNKRFDRSTRHCHFLNDVNNLNELERFTLLKHLLAQDSQSRSLHYSSFTKYSAIGDRLL